MSGGKQLTAKSMSHNFFTIPWPGVVALNILLNSSLHLARAKATEKKHVTPTDGNPYTGIQIQTNRSNMLSILLICPICDVELLLLGILLSIFSTSIRKLVVELT